jgi:hypothetical protein
VQQESTEASKTSGRRETFRRVIRRILRWSLIAACVLAILLLIWLRAALYHHWVGFPRQEAAWKALRAKREAVPPIGKWHEYRGILHAHSKFSHDSAVSFETILDALKTDHLDFICLSDHCVDGAANFDWQWRGLHDGKLFVPGFEMRDGFMPFGVAPGTVLSNRTDSATLARQIVEHGGVLFFAHPEEPRDWDRPELTGMEIYNIHADVKRHIRGLAGLLPDILVNQRRFPEQVMRLLFQRPTDFLKHWDELNDAGRHLTGIAGNDCHQNTGIKVVCVAPNEVRLEDTAKKVLLRLKLNWLTRPFMRLIFGPITPGRELFRFQLDPYARVASFVNTHLLAQDLSESSVLDALRAGRVFIGFDMIADSSGFQWRAEGGDQAIEMGEAGLLTAETVLRARSPLPCRFTVIQNGTTVHQAQGRALEWKPAGPGKYRVEAELQVLDEWVPWIYTNPIELKSKP